MAEELAGPAGITAAWWQMLGAVLGEPLPVSGIAREMGITRQSVQRIADLLVDAFGEAELADAVRTLERLSKVLDRISTGTEQP